MSETVAQIVAQIGGLSRQDRATLALAALLSLDSEDPDAEEAWDQELVRRAARIRSGESTGVPAEQVFAKWRRGRS